MGTKCLQHYDPRIIKKAAKSEITSLQLHCRISCKAIIIVQIQSSSAPPDAPSERHEIVSNHSSYVIGKGIHTNGICHVMLLCLEMNKVLGAGKLFTQVLSRE